MRILRACLVQMKINALAAKAHEGKLTAAEMGQRNNTISTRFKQVVDYLCWVNYPEVAILGAGTIVSAEPLSTKTMKSYRT